MVKEKGTFPNYLLTTSEKNKTEKSGHQSQPSSFIASGMHGATPSVPFLREHKNSFQRHQKENPQMRIRKDFVSEERLRIQEERREQSQQSYSFYKSRRPFRSAEIPSIWRSRNNNEEKHEINYDDIKEQLFVNTADLILIDLNPPSEPTKKTTKTENKKTNKALHRSLGLIMEQEQAHTRLQRNTIPDKASVNGVKSFFDEMNEQ